MSDVFLKKLHESVKTPILEHEGDAGFDLYAFEDVTLKPFERKLIATGLMIALPQNMEAQVRPKSGLALNHGVTLLNTPGTIDSSYRGEIKVLMINLGDKKFVVKKNTKIAQIVFNEIKRPKIIEVKELDDTSRGTGGFGSTGLE